MQKIKNPQFFLAPHLFFLIENGEILVWNYKLHEQYILEDDYFYELISIAKNNVCKNEKICKELLEANLISESSVDEKNWGWDYLSKIFHIGTQNISSKNSKLNNEELFQSYMEKCSDLKKNIPLLFLERKGCLIDLPKPDLESFKKISFYFAIKNRKTCRRFNSESIKLEELSSILFLSFGLIHGKEWEELKDSNLEQIGIRKSSPSGGGMHSEEVYIVVYRIKDLDPGLYHYRPQDHKLVQIKQGNFEANVIEMNYQQFFSEGLAFGIYLTSRLEKIWWKYKHSRSYRGVFLDIGHVSQVFLNSVTALGFRTWLTGAFHDSDVENFLSIDGSKEIPILFLGAGKGSNHGIPKIMIKQYQ